MFILLSAWSFPDHPGPSLAVYLETVRVRNTLKYIRWLSVLWDCSLLELFGKASMRPEGEKETILIRSKLLSFRMDAFTNDVFITRGKCSAYHLHINKHQGLMIWATIRCWKPAFSAFVGESQQVTIYAVCPQTSWLWSLCSLCMQIYYLRAKKSSAGPEK